MSNLDLSGLDFKEANLSGTNLPGTNLDVVWLMRANFSNANLTNGSLFAPLIYPGLEINLAERPNFAGVNLAGARVIARLNQVNLSGGNFARARMEVDRKNQPMA